MSENKTKQELLDKAIKSMLLGELPHTLRETTEWWKLLRKHFEPVIDQAHTAGRQEALEDILDLIENNPTPYMFDATKERFLTDIKNHLTE